MTLTPRQRLFRHRPVQIAAAVLALLVALLLYPRLTEPRFEGKSISEWIEQYPWDNGSGSDSTRALEHFGARAAPYYIDAIQRAENWETGLFSKIPRRYLRFVADPWVLQTIQSASLWKLGDLARQEIEQNKLQLDAAYPVADQALRLLEGHFQSLPPKTQGQYLLALQYLMPRHTNLYNSARSVFRTVNPRLDGEWQAMLEILTAARDTTIIPDLLFCLTNSSFQPLRATSPPWPRTQVAALEALGQIGHASPEVVAGLRTALGPPNAPEVILTAAVACANLGICPPEIAAVQDRVRKAVKASGLDRNSTWRAYVIAEPVLAWVRNPDDREAASSIKNSLAGWQSQYSHDRIRLAEILGNIGPKAKPFVPELVKMVQQDGPGNARVAAEALKRIDPTTAQAEILKMPTTFQR